MEVIILKKICFTLYTHILNHLTTRRKRNWLNSKKNRYLYEVFYKHAFAYTYAHVFRQPLLVVVLLLNVSFLRKFRILKVLNICKKFTLPWLNSS